MDSKKVSIIVPIYKVEEYLERCINSLCNQTYKNLEIILVDDGSPDKCPKICDDFQNKDKRVRVFHLKNGGPSIARNTALDKVNGDYICFVDSDDYIDEKFVETLYNNLIQNKADIAVCGYRKIYSDEQPEKIEETSVLKEYNSTEAIAELLSAYGKHNITNHMWNKIYKKELFDGIRFPSGYKFEDLAIMYLLFEKSNKIVYISQKLYNYTIRKNSLVHDLDEKSIDQKIQCTTIRSKYLHNKYDLLDKKIKEYDLKNALHCMCDLIKAVDIKNIKNNELYKKIMLIIINNKDCYNTLNKKEKIIYIILKSKSKFCYRILKKIK